MRSGGGSGSFRGGLIASGWRDDADKSSARTVGRQAAGVRLGGQLAEAAVPVRTMLGLSVEPVARLARGSDDMPLSIASFSPGRRWIRRWSAGRRRICAQADRRELDRDANMAAMMTDDRRGADRAFERQGRSSGVSAAAAGAGRRVLRAQGCLEAG